MIIMHKYNFSRYNKGRLTLQIESLNPERFVNLLWKNDVHIKKIKKKNIATVVMEVSLGDYYKIEELSRKTNTKIKILTRKGVVFSFLKLRKRNALLFGVLCFMGILYYLSTYIWKIEVVSEQNVSPYEIRQQLRNVGIKSGINKKRIDVKKIEESLLKNNENIIWVKVRTEGSRLKVEISERQIPPNLTPDNNPCNIVAKKDGQVVRIYTAAGTSVVQPGDIVKSGQLLVKGEQGKEGSTYQVHAKGSVLAKTYYEEYKRVTIKGVRKEKTGRKIVNYYIVVNNKKIYLKKAKQSFSNYEKKNDNSGLVKKEYYYEEKNKSFNLDSEKVTQDTGNKLYAKMIVNLDKSVKIIDKVIENRIEGDDCVIRVLLTLEEDISLEDAMVPST